MGKKGLVFVLITVLVAQLLSGCTVNSSDDSADTIVVAYMASGAVPKDVDMVSDAISEITREKYGFNVDLEIISASSYQQQLTLMCTSNTRIDLVSGGGVIYDSLRSTGALKDITELVNQYGDGIKNAVGEDRMRVGQIDGVQYAVPALCDITQGFGGFVCRTDILEKYHIDPESIQTYDDLTELFALIHAQEPDMQVLDLQYTMLSFLQYFTDWDILNDCLGVLENLGQTTTVTNLFESEQYMEFIKLVQKWHELGFISDSITPSMEAGASVMGAGNLFCYPSANKPGIESQESNASGIDLTEIQVGSNLKLTNFGFAWMIPNNSENPEAAMKFMNLLYTDPEIVNLFVYGIEGVHYQVLEDGCIDYPDGVTAATSRYNMSGALWAVGNEFLTYIWEGNDPDIWEKTKKWNESGIISEAYGFYFDSSSVATEKAAVMSVYSQYNMSLECGLVDNFETTIAEMNKKLYDAGLQTIIDEKQRQLERFLAAKKQIKEE